ncbi:hypothetical protein PHLCEN_2v886 [Hermanssonia centrifuga]|uniref:CRIB domain-containing protein n=1 Tax=Hermanssonia centrifuga TaxID=98765 RepID=A0A2R6S4N6_9APHY|nr:hypothetical protein PHLCEN_2v886 [Hermanssonia centrifuga]
MSSSRQNSRFSTLNVFKFGAQKPPPPPPKDPYYLANHSLVSLAQTVSPESYPSNPVAPMSAGPAYSVRSPSPGPSYTTSSAPAYAPSRSTSSTSLSTESGSMSSRKGFFKSLSLGKRPKTPKSAPSSLPSEQPLDPGEDPSISMPWNFQHNVHVDEASVHSIITLP